MWTRKRGHMTHRPVQRRRGLTSRLTGSSSSGCRRCGELVMTPGSIFACASTSNDFHGFAERARPDRRSVHSSPWAFPPCLRTRRRGQECDTGRSQPRGRFPHAACQARALPKPSSSRCGLDLRGRHRMKAVEHPERVPAARVSDGLRSSSPRIVRRGHRSRRGSTAQPCGTNTPGFMIMKPPTASA